MLSAMSAWGSNVSEPLTDLLGRGSVLARAHEQFDAGVRWITVLGPAGVGKSRLLLAIAAEVTPRDAPGGVWCCSLAGADTEAEVCARIAAVLPSADPSSLPQDGTRLGRMLAPMRIMLLLDDAERAVPTLSRWLPTWLAAAPHMRCLVGTRERLGGSGESVVRLDPLDPAAATDLFEQRAEAARGSALRPEERRLVGTLIERLDRLPLALELAAAQLGTLSAQDLLDSLDEHALRLASPDRAASRHASLEATLDLSWNLLDDAGRDALSTLALFEADPDIRAIHAVLPEASQLTALADRSWLVVERDVRQRYRLLGVVRAYIRARSERDPRRTERWIGYVSERSKELIDAWGDRASTIELCRLAADVRAALDAVPGESERALHLVTVLARVATARGPVPETLACMDRVLSQHRDATPARIDALLARGRLRARNAENEGSRHDYELALSTAEALNDASRAARSAASLADHVRHHGDTTRAEALYRRALEAVDELASRARLTASLAGLVAERGELAEAEELYEQAVASARAADDEVTEAAALQNFGLLLQERGELDRAETLCRRALELHVALGQRRFEAIAHVDLAGLALERARPLDAKTEASKAVGLAEHAGDRREKAVAQMLLAVALATLGEDAEPAFAKAESLITALDEPGLRSAHGFHRGHLELVRGNPERARDALLRSAKGDEARMAKRILAAAIARAERAAEQLVVARDGSWMRLVDGSTVDLSGRATLRAILAELVQGLRSGRALDAEALIAAGWSDRATTKSAKNRLHVALATLRKLGLADHLERSDEGYRLVACCVGGSDE